MHTYSCAVRFSTAVRFCGCVCVSVCGDSITSTSQLTGSHRHKASLPPYLRASLALTNIAFLLADAWFAYYVVVVLFAFLGVLLSPFFFCFHLLDLIPRVETLRVVVRSVTYNGRQLLMTVVLLAIVLFLFSIVAFNLFRETFVSVRARRGRVHRLCFVS